VDDPRDTRPVVPPGRGQILQFPKGSTVHAPSEATKRVGPTGDLSSAELFGLLWQALADVLGTAAAATLLRRAAQRAASTCPELLMLEITRATLEYQYKVPDAWNERAAAPAPALCELVRELWPFLIELTGSVVIGQLSQVPELRQRGIVPPGERQS
jgi:hypothetical protein